MRSIGTVFPAHALPETLPAFAARIEALGYDELWVVEDCFLSGGLTMAATAMAVTSRLRVGIGLLPAAVRNPAIAAMEIATLARIHPGRLSVAFGHGVEGWMEQIGARPPRRLAALGEVVEVVRSLLAGETVDIDGAFASITDVALESPPPEPPDILIGTTGPAGVRLAARVGDGVLLAEGSGARFVSQIGRELDAAAAGDRAPSQIVAYAWLQITDEPGARGALHDAVGRWAGSGLYPRATTAAGLAAGIGDAEPSDELVGEVAVAGTPETCAAAARRLFGAGANRLILAAVAPDFEAQYSRFAEEVLPLVRDAAQP